MVFHYRGKRKKSKKPFVKNDGQQPESTNEEYSFQHPSLHTDESSDVYEMEDDDDFELLPVKEKYPQLPMDTYEFPSDRLQKLHNRTDEFLDAEHQKEWKIEQFNVERPIQKQDVDRNNPIYQKPIFRQPWVWGFVMVSALISIYVAYWLVSILLPKDFLF